MNLFIVSKTYDELAIGVLLQAHEHRIQNKLHCCMLLPRLNDTTSAFTCMSYLNSVVRAQKVFIHRLEPTLKHKHYEATIGLRSYIQHHLQANKIRNYLQNKILELTMGMRYQMYVRNVIPMAKVKSDHICGKCLHTGSQRTWCHKT